MRPPEPAPDAPLAPSPGLCGTCLHSRRIETARGSLFRLCERSVSDPAYPRYPTLPVVRCSGYERASVDLVVDAAIPP